MAYDETASTSKWTISRTLAWRSGAAKEKSPADKKIIPARLRATALNHNAASPADVHVCVRIAPFSREKQEGNREKLLTRRSAFIHDVSFPIPMPKAWLFRRSTVTASYRLNGRA